MKLNEQIAFLRKKKGMTQEQLASALGVTNQSVSKWESGQNCPDIQLLPELARLFDVTIDALMGYDSEDSLADLMLRVRGYMKSVPVEMAMETAYRIAALLHEGAVTFGCNETMYWSKEHDYATEDMAQWGWSLINDAGHGCSGRNGMGVFFALPKCEKPLDGFSAEKIAYELNRYGDAGVLQVMFALFRRGHDEGVSMTELTQLTGLDEAAVNKALLTLHAEMADGGWKLDERQRHIPALISHITML